MLPTHKRLHIGILYLPSVLVLTLLAWVAATPPHFMCDRGDCMLIEAQGGSSSGGPVCGNAIVETGEQCDDGNTVNGDGCSSTCQVELPPSTSSSSSVTPPPPPATSSSSSAAALSSEAPLGNPSSAAAPPSSPAPASSVAPASAPPSSAPPPPASSVASSVTPPPPASSATPPPASSAATSTVPAPQSSTASATSNASSPSVPPSSEGPPVFVAPSSSTVQPPSVGSPLASSSSTVRSTQTREQAASSIAAAARADTQHVTQTLLNAFKPTTQQLLEKADQGTTLTAVDHSRVPSILQGIESKLAALPPPAVLIDALAHFIPDSFSAIIPASDWARQSPQQVIALLDQIPNLPSSATAKGVFDAAVQRLGEVGIAVDPSLLKAARAAVISGRPIAIFSALTALEPSLAPQATHDPAASLDRVRAALSQLLDPGILRAMGREYGLDEAVTQDTLSRISRTADSATPRTLNQMLSNTHDIIVALRAAGVALDRLSAASADPQMSDASVKIFLQADMSLAKTMSVTERTPLLNDAISGVARANVDAFANGSVDDQRTVLRDLLGANVTRMEAMSMAQRDRQRLRQMRATLDQSILQVGSAHPTLACAADMHTELSCVQSYLTALQSAVSAQQSWFERLVSRLQDMLPSRTL